MSLPAEFWNQYVEVDGLDNPPTNFNKTPLSEANVPKSRSSTPRTPQNKEGTDYNYICLLSIGNL